MAERTARRFMEVATAYASKSATVADLTPTALYELAAPSTPQPIRDEVEALLVDGQKVTVADILRSELHLMRVHLTHGLTSSGDRT